MKRTPVGVFTIRWLRWFLGSAFALFFLLSLPTIFDPGKGGIGLQVFSVLFSLAVAGLTFQAARSATVLAYEDGVTVRTFPRTRHWAWSEIERFDARTGSFGWMGYRRRVLWIVPNTGRPKRTDLNCRRRPDGEPTSIDSISAALNMLRKQHTA